jgi:hypothetical protein
MTHVSFLVRLDINTSWLPTIRTRQDRPMETDLLIGTVIANKVCLLVIEPRTVCGVSGSIESMFPALAAIVHGASSWYSVVRYIR